MVSEVPDPPDLTNRSLPEGFDPDAALDSIADLRRGELETALRESAWSGGFEEWATYTDLTDEEIRSISEAGLFEALDFYWDPIDERLRYEVPAVPPHLAGETELGATVATELATLGDVVIELLAEEYVDWGAETPRDVWGNEPFDPTDEPED